MTISEELRKRILAQILNGDSYKKAGLDNCVGVGTCFNIVEEERKRTLDFDEVRRFMIAFKKHKLNPFDAERVSKFAELMNDFGLNFNDLQDVYTVAKMVLAEKIYSYRSLVKQLSFIS